MITLIALASLVAHTRSVAVEPETKIIGFEYAFTIPATLPAGRRSFRFENRGKRAHELNISLLRPGVSIQQFITAANAGKPLSPFIDVPVGVLFAPPSGSSPSALTTDLRPGRTYAVICIFRDSAGKPRHHELGMYSAITVQNGPAAKEPQLPTDTVVGMDYAFRTATTLSPGVHYLTFVNTGKHRHEVSVSLLKKGVSPRKISQFESSDDDIDNYLDEKLGLLHAQPGVTPAGLLRINVLPGRVYL